MRKLTICAILLVISFATVKGALLDIPMDLRQENYTLSDEPWNRGGNNEGSCVYASTVSLLRAHGFEDIATWWRETYHSGATQYDITRAMDSTAIRYACTRDGSVEFLEWACDNRLGAVIFWKPAHCCTLVDLTDTHAVILDNNSTGHYEYYDRESFIYYWQTFYEGFAVTAVYTPPPPWPAPRPMTPSQVDSVAPIE